MGIPIERRNLMSDTSRLCTIPKTAYQVIFVVVLYRGSKAVISCQTKNRCCGRWYLIISQIEEPRHCYRLHDIERGMKEAIVNWYETAIKSRENKSRRLSFVIGFILALAILPTCIVNIIASSCGTLKGRGRVKK